MSQQNVLVLNANTKREQGRAAQRANIEAAQAVADIIRTVLGPHAMLKMILDPMGGITITSDGNAILREIDVSHPAAKSVIELSRTQDEEVGDGTTSVIILAGELLSIALPFLERKIHPRIIVGAYLQAMDIALESLERHKIVIDVDSDEQVIDLVVSALGTKFVSRFGNQIATMALQAVRCITITNPETKRKEIDIKRYARVEKIPGDFLESSRVLDGVMLNKDIIHPQMRRRIANPRVLLLDCPLEYKKGESKTNLPLKDKGAFEELLKAEEQEIEQMCVHIIKAHPDLLITEKGVSDLAQHYLQKAGISVLRRVRKTDNNRIARAVGATIVNEAAAIREEDIGKGCGMFKVEKIGDEYFSYLVECKAPKACTIVLRGASKEVLNEMERNLQDAMAVVRNVLLEPSVVAGGGAVEMAIGQDILRESKKISGIQQLPFKAVASAFEVIPRTLIENCGASVIRQLTALRAKHAATPVAEKCTWGINGETGDLANMTDLKILDSYAVKAQTIKTAIEAAAMLLRIDDIVSGMSDKKAQETHGDE